MPNTNSTNAGPKKAKVVKKVATKKVAPKKVETEKVAKVAKVAPEVKVAKVVPEVSKAAPKKAAPKKAAPKKAAPKKVATKKVATKKVATKAKSSKKTEKVKTGSPTPAEAVAEPIAPAEPVAEAPAAPVVEPVSDTPYMGEFSSVLSDMDAALTLIRNLRARVQKLEKQVHRDHKATQKKLRGKKRRIPNPNAEPTGFQKPGPVSPELATFLSLTKDELISRTDVTRRINAYCKGHNLQNPKDKREIFPDAPIRKLLKMNKTDELTFFNLQKYMKVHYPNKEGVYPTA